MQKRPAGASAYLHVAVEGEASISDLFAPQQTAPGV
jgi:hypothetical protein